jgi:hypothetical protein
MTINLQQVNSISPYLFIEKLNNNSFTWSYNCVSSEDIEENILKTLDECLFSYIKWATKQLDNEFLMFEEDCVEDIL